MGLSHLEAWGGGEQSSRHQRVRNGEAVRAPRVVGSSGPRPLGGCDISREEGEGWCVGAEKHLVFRALGHLADGPGQRGAVSSRKASGLMSLPVPVLAEGNQRDALSSGS